MAPSFRIPAAMHQGGQRRRGMAEKLSQSKSTGTKYAKPHDSNAQIRAAPDNPLSKPVNFYSSGYCDTKKGATIRPSPTKKENNNP
jgi:hypothetical protein